VQPERGAEGAGQPRRRARRQAQEAHRAAGHQAEGDEVHQPQRVDVEDLLDEPVERDGEQRAGGGQSHDAMVILAGGCALGAPGAPPCQDEQCDEQQQADGAGAGERLQVDAVGARGIRDAVGRAHIRAAWRLEVAMIAVGKRLVSTAEYRVELPHHEAGALVGQPVATAD
jgi:hypothetical protein